MKYYPLCLDISGKKCVVVGGGKVAERKVRRLMECGALVTVVGKDLTQGLSEWKGEGRIVHHDSLYDDDCLAGACLVIGATNDWEVNGRVAKDARHRGIPVNIADDPARCDFILPSIVDRGDLQILVSTGGKSPALAKKLREELEGRYGPEYAVLLSILGELREKVIAGRASADTPEPFTALVGSDILEAVRLEDWDRVRETIRRLTGIEMEVKRR